MAVSSSSQVHADPERQQMIWEGWAEEAKSQSPTDHRVKQNPQVGTPAYSWGRQLL